jgi:hypothetical protein
MRFFNLATPLALLGLVTAGLITTHPVRAAWSADPAQRTAVTTADYRQYFPRLVQTGQDFVVTWNDRRRDNSHVDVYAQKFNLNGDMLWAGNGRVIAAGPANQLVYPNQFSAGVVTDANGGALIAWNDSSGSSYWQAFASRAASNATVAWGSPGEQIQSPDTAMPFLANPTTGANQLRDDWGIVADSENGMFIPLAAGLGRVNSEGRLRTNWFYDSSDTISANRVFVPTVSSTGKDGVVVVWNQGNSYFSQGIRARKLVDPESKWPAQKDTFGDSWGQKVVFQPDGTMPLCRLSAVPDGAGGVIAVWVDGRIVTDTTHFRVYAQRIDSSGHLMWGTQSLELSGDVVTYTCYWWSKMFAASDGEGGVVVAWNDAQGTVRAQRVKADGSLQWQSGGVSLLTDADVTHLTTHGVIRASDGNFIVLYHQGSQGLLVAQKLNAVDGLPLWGDGQVAYEGCFSPYNAGTAPMVSDGQGGAVVVWETCDNDIYAHRVLGIDAVTYSVGGSVSNLAGSGLVLQNNGADDLAIAANGPFSFATELLSGSSYSVRVATQPAGQTCTVTNGNGTISNADVTNIGVSCVNGEIPVFEMNAGLNDAWYNPATSGQGFFITVFPDLGAVSLAWFTYDTSLPPIDATANLGDPGHRWLTALGLIDKNQALMDIEMTSGGLFDTYTEITRTDPPGSDGTILLTFDNCYSGTIEYDIPSINRQGIVPIQRVAIDNAVLCEALATD